MEFIVAMKGSTCIAFIVLVLAVMPVAVVAEDKFHLGDLVELISLLPHIYHGIVGLLMIWKSDGLFAIFTVVSFWLYVVFILIEFFKPCLHEASNIKYQPVRIAVNIWSACDRDC